MKKKKKPASSNAFSALQAFSEDAETANAAAAEAAEQRRQNGAASGSKDEGHAGGLKLPLIWLDLEMTGLDLECDTILQIACIVTDGDLERSIEGPEVTIHHPEEVLERMNDWCIENHGKSGLTQAVRESTIGLAEAEQIVLQFIMEHVPEPNTGVVAGNSVHVDVAFLKRHMPRLAEHLHYRIVDVSSVGELARRWFPKEYMRGPKKKNAHTAMSDIRESIEQLKWYRQSIFKKWAGMSEPRR